MSGRKLDYSHMSTEKYDILSHRFTDSSQTLHHFSACVLVHCPRCKKKATVYTDHIRKQSEVKCSECHFTEKAKKWYGLTDLVVHQRCDTCGNWIDMRVRESKVRFTHLRITCSGCGEEKLYKPLKEKVYAGSHQAIDPYFGLPLWLQAAFGNYTLWAYNYEHLQFLRAYIGAKLREKNGLSRRTLALKLPLFIKAAKNRNALLKLLDKLERNSL